MIRGGVDIIIVLVEPCCILKGSQAVFYCRLYPMININVHVTTHQHNVFVKLNSHKHNSTTH